jgi:O-antigen/teichoic acid export membrane protein
MPVALFAHLNLRAVLATDVGEKHPFGDYARVRMVANAVALVVLALLAAAAGLPILIVGASILVDNTSDLLFGFQQRRNRLDIVAQSMTIRSVISVAFVVVFVYMWRSATAAASGLLAGRVITFLAWDWPRASLPPDARSDPWGVLRDALPLGFTQMLITLSSTLPRYAIERFTGTRELGVFAAVASFITVGGVIVNSLGQAAMTRLAEHRRSDRAEFHSLTRRMVAGVAALGALAAICAWLLGAWVLSVLYTPEYADYDELLIVTLAAGSVGWIAQMMGFVTTSARAFRAQLPLVAAVCATSGLASFAAVPWIGLYGAALAIALSSAVAIAGQILILRRSV